MNCLIVCRHTVLERFASDPRTVHQERMKRRRPGAAATGGAQQPEATCCRTPEVLSQCPPFWSWPARES